MANRVSKNKINQAASALSPYNSNFNNIQWKSSRKQTRF